MTLRTVTGHLAKQVACASYKRKTLFLSFLPTVADLALLCKLGLEGRKKVEETVTRPVLRYVLLPPF